MVERFLPVAATRIVADPAALDSVEAPGGGHLLRLAPDDLLVLPALSRVDVADPQAIVDQEGGFYGAWLDGSEEPALQARCGWEFPERRPAFVQGHVAGVPVKLLFTGDRVLLLTPTVTAHHLAARLDPAPELR